MQFFPYKEFLAEVKPAGVVPRPQGERVYFSLETRSGSPAGLLFGDTVAFDADAPDSRRFDASRERLPALLESLFHKAHVSDVAIIPAGKWRDLLNVALYELAKDEAWLEIDAEASLHQNGRDPLLLEPGDHHVLARLAGALLESEDAADGDFTAVALGSPMLVEFRQKGAVVAWCASAAIADEIADALRV